MTDNHYGQPGPKYQALVRELSEAKPSHRYGIALDLPDLTRHENYLQLADGLHQRITHLEDQVIRQDRANHIYAGIATSSTIVSFLAAAIALSMWTSR